MIAIVDYGMGNLASIENMLRKSAIECRIESNPDKLSEASRLILPGVGHFDRGMQEIKDRGFDEAIVTLVTKQAMPILGVCLGMQLLCKSSAEGSLPGLGLLDASFVAFESNGDKAKFKQQHMGWNSVSTTYEHALFADLEPDMRFYFVHGYYCITANPAITIGTTHYGTCFASAIADNNIMGVQFHPEKSHRFGMQLYKNFARIA